MNIPFQHDTQPVTGILITNLGTPDAATAKAVRKYLAEFLWDPRVIDKPRWLWWLILHGIILRIRPAKVAKNYAKVWTKEGSPLLCISKLQQAQLQKSLTYKFNHPVHVELAMRYGTPTVEQALKNLRKLNVQRLIVLPLYPQFSATTTASTFDAIAQTFKQWRYLPETRFIQHYHDNPEYIQAIADSITQYQTEHGIPDKLLFSFHSLPERYLYDGDPYYCECQKSARLVAEKLSLSPEQWQIAFQSRFGPEKWLGPYTDKTLQSWGEQGVKYVQVVCPGFAADCLETLEEIAMQNKETFLHAGGNKYDYIPALNADEQHIHALADIVVQTCSDWTGLPVLSDELLQGREKRAAESANNL